jgi:hypothetical protein
VDGPGAAALHVHARGLAAVLLARVHDHDLAAVAADRAVRRAAGEGDVTLLGAAASRLANVLLSAGRSVEAADVALGAAGRLERHVRAEGPAAAVRGGLLLAAAVALARRGAAVAAGELIGEAGPWRVCSAASTPIRTPSSAPPWWRRTRSRSPWNWVTAEGRCSAHAAWT